MIGPMFIDRESGVTVRVESVSDAYAQITVIRQLQSTWSMKLSEYDTVFVKRYLPLDTGAGIKPGDKFRLPANADYWEQEKVAIREQAEAEARGETEEGVRIGAPDSETGYVAPI